MVYLYDNVDKWTVNGLFSFTAEIVVFFSHDRHVETLERLEKFCQRERLPTKKITRHMYL